MRICDDQHDGIVYDSRHCPLCSVLSDLKDAKETITDLEEELADKPQ